ncbi:MAG: hypothetical protein AVDCRST_MAG02-2130, partial [uncultured Rubrobacteraceae bacterium]
ERREAGRKAAGGAPAQDPQLPGHRGHLDVDEQPPRGHHARHGRGEPSRPQPGLRRRRPSRNRPSPRTRGARLPCRRRLSPRDEPDARGPRHAGAVPDPAHGWL